MKHKWRRVEIYKHLTSPELGDMCVYCGEVYTKTEVRNKRRENRQWYIDKLTEECPDGPK